MKISCQSCSAKYTIADEKVLGKIVKIRCKKCSATIVINGNEQTAASSAPMGDTQDPGVYDYTQQGGTEQWTVNVADGDQRTMTSAEIVDAYKQMVVNDETYCWKDGMSDWLPLREIEALYAQCTLGPRPSLAPEASMPQMAPLMPAQDEQPTRVQETNLGQLFGSAPPPAMAQPASVPPPAATNGNGAGALYASAGNGASSGAAARRAGGRGGAGADLFGGVAQAGGEDDVMTSVAGSGMAAPVPPAGDGKLTGQRNENSVLFSLSALTNNAPKEDKASAVGEGSGLIDIRALSASMENKQQGGNAKVDDIMNLAGGGAFTPALAAPVLAPPAMDAPSGFASIAPGGEGGKSNKTLIFAIVGAGAFIAIAIVAVALILSGGKKDDAGTATANTAGTTTTTTATTATAATTATPTDTATAAPTGAAPADTSTPQAANTSKSPTTNAAKPPTGAAPPPATTTAAAAPTTAPTPKPPSKPAAGPCGCAPGDVDCAIRCSVKKH